MRILGLKGLRNRIPDSGKFLLVKWASQEIFACGILNPGLWNPEYSSRNPESREIPSPSSTDKDSRIQYLESGIDGVESEIKVYLGLPSRPRLFKSWIPLSTG